MKKKSCIIIPVRLDSERFPNKLLTEYNGLPIIQHVIKTAINIRFHLSNVDIFIATNNYNSVISEITKKFNINYFIMNGEVSCGSERVKYVYQSHPSYNYYISLPADEPSMFSGELTKSINNIISYKNNALYTLYTQFYCQEDLEDVRSCKLIIDTGDNVIYTSRAIIPASKSGDLHDLSIYKKHLGVFVFPNKLLKKKHMVIWSKESLSSLEGLEQNMFINRDFTFKAIKTNHIGFGIDSPDQIKKLEERFKNKK